MSDFYRRRTTGDDRPATRAPHLDAPDSHLARSPPAAVPSIDLGGNAMAQGRVYYAKGKGGALELVVPHGTKLIDLLKAQEQISRDILPHISPGGCGPCLSGIPFVIREELSQVARVELASGEIVHG
jgi:hypothetical protein